MPHALTELLLAHRANGTLLSQLPPEHVPQSADEAYRIQGESVAALGPVGAWKVQPMPQSGEPFAAPILASTIFADGATLRASDFAGLGIEVEVALTLNRDLPAIDGGYSPEQMRTAIGSIHVALEILASRFLDRSQLPPLAGIADLQSSGGIVLGPAVPAEILPEWGGQAMSLTLDGAEAATTSGNATTDTVLASLAWLANHAAARGLDLKSGDIVITGARIGPISFSGRDVLAEAPGLGTVAVRFT